MPLSLPQSKSKMRNILRESISQDELRAIFTECPPIPLLPPHGDARWQECAGKPATQMLLSAILPRAQAERHEPLPFLSDELYREFHRSGNRMKFEKVYFERRRRLARAVFCALFAPDAETWIPVVLRDWDDIFGEESWGLPSHVKNTSGRDPFGLDLFAAETANLMGELLNVFAAHAGDARRAAIQARLREQFFLNYLEYPQRCAWTSSTNNWNAVCHQGVLGGALSVEDDADLLARLFDKAATNLPGFLSGFTPDGGCSEGPGYWNYGFGWFAVLNEQLETRTRGALSLFEGDPLIEEIARFGRRTLLAPNRVANFADGGADDLPRASLLTYLGERLGDAGNKAEAQAQYLTLAQSTPKIDELRVDTFFLLRTVLFAPTEKAEVQPGHLENVYLPALAWWISHGCDSAGTRWALAAKAGHNGEHHNHNDCGSFILILNGQSVLDEIGSSEYTRDFFSPKRFGFLATRTLGHSLPIINGCEQSAGAQFQSHVLKAEFGSEFDEFSVDLTACYPPIARCNRYIRTLRVVRNPFSIELRDEFECDAEEVSIECALVTHGSWEQREKEILVRAGGETLRIEMGEGSGKFVRGEEHLYSDKHDGKPVRIARLVFAPAFHGCKAHLALKLGAAMG